MGVASAQSVSQEPPATEVFELALSAPPSCERTASLKSAVLRLVPDAARHAVRAEVTLTETQGQWHALVLLSGSQSGTRELQAPTCESALKASALIIGLSLDPEGTLAMTDAEEQKPPKQTAPPPPKPPPPLPPKAKEPEPIAFGIYGGGALARAVFPKLGVGPELGVVLDAPLWDVGFQVGFIPAADIDKASVGSAQFSLLRAELGACGSLLRLLENAPTDVELSVCAAVLGNRLSAEAVGSIETLPKAQIIPSIAGQLKFKWPHRSVVALTASAGAEAPLKRYVFAIENAGDLHTMSPIAVRAALGLTIRLY